MLLFSVQTHVEAVRKPILGERNQSLNTSFWGTLKKHTLNTVNETGIKIERVTKQVGNSFGERITNAISQTFEKGYERLIVLGIDNPNLTADAILHIDDHLQKQDWAIEPAIDGGINVIGINKRNFIPEVFAQLPWQSDKLLTEFVNQARKTKQNLSILCSTPDFDSKTDLDLWLQQPKNVVLSFIIRSILYKGSGIANAAVVSRTSTSEDNYTSLRAPPY